MIAFASAIEPLRLANQVSGQKLYEWKLVSEDGQDVACSNGTVVRVDMGLGPVGRDDTVLVCGGIDVAEATTKPVLSWLRRDARQGSAVGGLCTGAWTVAKAGLLEDRRATIHWENQDSFEEDFIDIHLTKSVFVIDGNRLTTAGGTASIDLMLRLIARGYTYKEVAAELFISIKTVETHVSSVLRKLQLSNRTELTRWAADRRIV